MPRVVPSQVVSFIATLKMPAGIVGVSMINAGPSGLSAILDLTEQIPDELLTMSGEDYSSLIHAKSTIRDILNTWNANTSAGHKLQPYNYSVALSPIEMIRRVLATCPDEAPAPGTSHLDFITDLDLRENLRNDTGAINRALSNGEWKAATILAGSGAEALLLWALKEKSTVTVAGAVASLMAKGQLKAQPNSNLDYWNLHQYIEVAEELKIIKPNTAKQSRLAKDFRNFIHPGVAQRTGDKCDRATALSAVAGVEHIVRDLTPP
jgi:hypothetical protein